MIVRPDAPDAADVRELLEQHLVLMRSQSPPQDVHALAGGDLQEVAVAFLSCRQEGRLLGIGALARVTGTHAELKSMHTAHAARGRGVGRLVLRSLLEVAVLQGFSRVSLETGSQPEFDAARGLYVSEGFVSCEPFGGYLPSDASTFLTRALP